MPTITWYVDAVEQPYYVKGTDFAVAWQDVWLKKSPTTDIVEWHTHPLFSCLKDGTRHGNGVLLQPGGAVELDDESGSICKVIRAPDVVCVIWEVGPLRRLHVDCSWSVDVREVRIQSGEQQHCMCVIANTYYLNFPVPPAKGVPDWNRAEVGCLVYMNPFDWVVSSIEWPTYT